MNLQYKQVDGTNVLVFYTREEARYFAQRNGKQVQDAKKTGKVLSTGFKRWYIVL
jgi:hypothetical protein